MNKWKMEIIKQLLKKLEKEADDWLWRPLCVVGCMFCIVIYIYLSHFSPRRGACAEGGLGVCSQVSSHQSLSALLPSVDQLQVNQVSFGQVEQWGMEFGS